ncbi:MAG: hypothetical protein MUO27_06335, partial [Sedimentisphaerales bacterium]|nr:hypothetical protein [Sedimentisphaerales bacterium]
VHSSVFIIRCCHYELQTTNYEHLIVACLTLKARCPLRFSAPLPSRGYFLALLCEMRRPAFRLRPKTDLSRGLRRTGRLVNYAYGG